MSIGKPFAVAAAAFAFASSCAIRDAAVEQRKLPRRPEVDVTSVGAFRGWSEPNDPPAEERFRNIQVLEGLPASELYPVMAFFSNSLGVTCEHCHTEYFSEDSKHTKQIARQMVRLTRAINQAQFQGEPTVTCWTCHHGQEYPPTIPRLERAGWMAEGGTDPRPLPAAEQVLAAYRASTGSIEEVRASGTVRAVGGLGERHEARFALRWTAGGAVEVETEVELPPPVGERLGEVELGMFDPGSRYRSFEILQRERIGEVDAVTFLGETEDGVYEWVSFDAVSGALVRIRTGTPTALGFVPEEIRFRGWTPRGPSEIEWARGDFLVTFTIEG